jgi:hypothetical protein
VLTLENKVLIYKKVKKEADYSRHKVLNWVALLNELEVLSKVEIEAGEEGRGEREGTVEEGTRLCDKSKLSIILYMQ